MLTVSTDGESVFDGKAALNGEEMYAGNKPNTKLYKVDANVLSTLSTKYKNIEISGMSNYDKIKAISIANTYVNADMSSVDELTRVEGLVVFANKPPKRIKEASNAKVIFKYDKNWFDNPKLFISHYHTLDFSNVPENVLKNSVDGYEESSIANGKYLIVPEEHTDKFFAENDPNAEDPITVYRGAEEAEDYPYSDADWEAVGNGTKSVDRETGLISLNKSKTSAVKQSLLEKLLANNQKTYS